MGTQIIQQPNGLYALFAGEIDDFVLLDGTEKDVYVYFIQAAVESTKKSVTYILQKQKRGEPAYMNFTKTFEEAVEIAADIHGEDSESVKVARRILERAGETESSSKLSEEPPRETK